MDQLNKIDYMIKTLYLAKDEIEKISLALTLALADR